MQKAGLMIPWGISYHARYHSYLESGAQKTFASLAGQKAKNVGQPLSFKFSSFSSQNAHSEIS